MLRRLEYKEKGEIKFKLRRHCSSAPEKVYDVAPLLIICNDLTPLDTIEKVELPE